MTDGRPGSDATAFDVAIVGAGVNGAAICHALTRAGYRVLLVDQADIGSGTSQASTMLVWGGLLYLRRLEISTVVALSRDRDRLIAERSDLVRPQSILYVPSNDERRLLVSGALSAYWALSAGRRRWPRRLTRFPEQRMLADGRAAAYEFEEATLVESDARFVLAWALDAERLGADVLSYVRVDAATPHRDGSWRLGLCDTLSGATTEVVARLVVNAAGVWTDQLNGRARISTPWRHAFSRGVSIALPRDPGHTRHVVVDSRVGDALTLAPWGPVSLWASTDGLEPDLARAQQFEPRDVRALLDEHNRHFRARHRVDDVVSVRVGVRALPVAHDDADVSSSLALTRHHRVHLDERNWISVYGGKLSGCLGLAEGVTALVVRRLPRRPATGGARPAPPPSPPPELTHFPGLDMPVVAPAWSAAHEHCCRLDDYLRRRTNIAQWVPNGGFGRRFEHAEALERIALDIHQGDAGLAARELITYYRDMHDRQARVDRADPARTAAARPDPPPGRLAGAIPSEAAPPIVRPRSATARWRRES